MDDQGKQQRPTPTTPRRRTGLRWMALGVVLLVMTACGAASATPTSPPAPAPTAAPPATATPAAAGPGQEICRVTLAGTYYLLVISAAEHDFRACSGDAPYAGTLDDLLNLPGMDRRCIIDNPTAIAHNHANVAVYSDSQSADLDAAATFCRQEGGTADG